MDNNQNKSKQIIFSIVGVALLIVVVVGVTYAFFTYSRTGTTNNVITTGKINFVYADNNSVELTNQFPATTEKGKENAAFTFSIKGELGAGSNPIEYTVYGIQGDAEASKTRMKDSEIRVFAEITKGSGGTGTPTISGSYGGTDGAIAGDSASGFEIAKGTLPAGESIDHEYSVQMWVDKDVKISDTDARANYRASSKKENPTDVPKKCGLDETKETNGCLEGEAQDEREVYSNVYYSLKIKVTAHDQVGA